LNQASDLYVTPAIPNKSRKRKKEKELHQKHPRSYHTMLTVIIALASALTWKCTNAGDPSSGCKMTLEQSDHESTILRRLPQGSLTPSSQQTLPTSSLHSVLP
jgi:hypothetical protein